MNMLADRLANFEGKRVAVLADLVADVFVNGEISRISREAPVLILNHLDTQIVPGGGGNAIHNLKTLGAEPIPVGIVGDDVEGHSLLEFFSRIHIDTSGIRIVKNYRTPSKTRILAGAIHGQRQQIVRIDSTGTAISESVRKETQRKLARVIAGADALRLIRTAMDMGR